MDTIQITKLLAEGQHLLAVIDEKLASKVLETDDNAKSAAQRSLLDRLVRSIEQYINKEQSLVYVGFVGHFSSGKSTTINNLLDLHNTSEERKTSLNPTDLAITLITNKPNSNSLLMMNRETIRVPVRTNFITNDFLSNLVIADTPGSGDPQIVNEMIQDFLPICDYILYFISSTNPIDEADIPLLRQKHIKLPFIPLHFVITRTDEFRIHPNQPLKEDNIDHPKRDAFIGQLISRLREFTGAGNITPANFTFIDNLHNYHLEDLKSKLNSLSKGVDNDQLLRNHAYKVDFYLKNFNEIKSYFTSLIQEKIRVSDDFLSTANENIQRFDKSVDVNNDKLRSIWLSSKGKLEKTKEMDYDAIKVVLEKTLPDKIEPIQRLWNERQEIRKGIENQSNGYHGYAILELRSAFKRILLEIKEKVLSGFEDVDLLTSDITETLPKKFQLDSFSHTIDIDFSKLNEPLNKYADYVYGEMQHIKTMMLNKVESLRSIMAGQLIVGNVVQAYQDGSNVITDNFNSYFEMVEMYKNTVLTRNTKETIQKLRIGQQLDELDDNFSEQFRSTTKEEAIVEIYYPNDTKILEFQQAIQDYDLRAGEIKNQISNISPVRIQNNDRFQKEAIETSKLFVDIIQTIEQDVNILYTVNRDQLVADHTARFANYERLAEVRKKERRKAMWKWSGIAALIALIIFGLLYKLNIIPSNTIPITIVLGLGTTILGQLIGFFLTGISKDLNKMLIKHKLEFRKTVKEKLVDSYSDIFWEDAVKKMSDSLSKKQGVIEAIFDARIQPYYLEIHGASNDALKEIHLQNEKLTSLIEVYNTRVSLFHDTFQMIFADPDQNIKKIKGITRQIKDKAIQPSFALLEDTKTELEGVNKKITEIENTTIGDSSVIFA